MGQRGWMVGGGGGCSQASGRKPQWPGVSAKGREDLHLDERVMQFLRIASDLLRASPAPRRPTPTHEGKHTDRSEALDGLFTPRSL